MHRHKDLNLYVIVVKLRDVEHNMIYLAHQNLIDEEYINEIAKKENPVEYFKSIVKQSNLERDLMFCLKPSYLLLTTII